MLDKWQDEYKYDIEQALCGLDIIWGNVSVALRQGIEWALFELDTKQIVHIDSKLVQVYQEYIIEYISSFYE